jgi:hypothetical protein
LNGLEKQRVATHLLAAWCELVPAYNELVHVCIHPGVNSMATTLRVALEHESISTNWLRIHNWRHEFGIQVKHSTRFTAYQASSRRRCNSLPSYEFIVYAKAGGTIEMSKHQRQELSHAFWQLSVLNMILTLNKQKRETRLCWELQGGRIYSTTYSCTSSQKR